MIDIMPYVEEFISRGNFGFCWRPCAEEENDLREAEYYNSAPVYTVILYPNFSDARRYGLLIIPKMVLSFSPSAVRTSAHEENHFAAISMSVSL